MIDAGDVDVFPGLDAGKGEHQATAVTPAGKKAFDKRLPDTEPKLRELFAKLQAKHGTVLVVVDQPASIGALPLAVARDRGCPVAHLPGLTMRRIADLYPGEAKTDARDAFIIADAARAMPHTLRAIDGEDETIAELEMIVGFDDDPAEEAARVANRLHGLLTQIHPSLERVLGPRLQHPAVLTLLERFGSPDQIRKAGHRHDHRRRQPQPPARKALSPYPDSAHETPTASAQPSARSCRGTASHTRRSRTAASGSFPSSNDVRNCLYSAATAAGRNPGTFCAGRAQPRATACSLPLAVRTRQ